MRHGDGEPPLDAPLGGERHDVGAVSGVSRSTLYLARHGRTALNAAGVLRGRLDPPLDDVGRMEALYLADALVDVGATLVVASPLRRAVETAEAVAGRLALDPSVDPRLVDRDYGRWAGTTRDELEKRWGTVDRAPGVEPLEEVRVRVSEALVEVVRRAAGSSAVVVSHDAVLRTALVTCDPDLGDPDGLAQHTGCFNVIEHCRGSWSVRSVNDVPLRGATRSTRRAAQGARTGFPPTRRYP